MLKNIYTKKQNTEQCVKINKNHLTSKRQGYHAGIISVRYWNYTYFILMYFESWYMDIFMWAFIIKYHITISDWLK